jgi:hypothetical protein
MRCGAGCSRAELVVLPKAGHWVGPKTAARLTALLVPFLAEDEEEAESEDETAKPAPR